MLNIAGGMGNVIEAREETIGSRKNFREAGAVLPPVTAPSPVELLKERVLGGAEYVLATAINRQVNVGTLNLY